MNILEIVSIIAFAVITGIFIPFMIIRSKKNLSKNNNGSTINQNEILRQKRIKRKYNDYLEAKQKYESAFKRYQYSRKCYEITYLEQCKIVMENTERWYNAAKAESLSYSAAQERQEMADKERFQRQYQKDKEIEFLVNVGKVVGVLVLFVIAVMIGIWIFQIGIGAFFAILFGGAIIGGFGFLIGEKYENIFSYGLVTIGMTAFVGAILAPIIWIWYWICGGALIFDNEPFGPIVEGFWEIFFWFLFTLIPLGFVIGFIAILFGWNPPK